MKKLHLAVLSAALLASLPALANTNLVLDFEGVDSFASVADFYAGVSFSDAALGLKNDELGTYFSNAPTPGTVMFATDSSAVMSVDKGFIDQLSFYYSAASSALDVVTIYSGLNGTGSELGSISLSKNAQLGGCSDSAFCNWQRISLTFSGTARSVSFGGNAGGVAFDNVAITAVPEPTSALLMALGGAALLIGARKRQQA
jgi:hypothetical protein